MALEGDLRTMPIRELLGWIADRKATGQLSLSRGMVARRFHLRSGRVMLASSTEEASLLGRLLVEAGLVDEGRLLQVLGSRSAGPSRARLGKTLVEAGLVSADDIARVLADKVERLLADALTWTEGTFHFDESAPPRAQAAVSTAVNLAVILERPVPRTRSAARDRVVPVSDADVIEIRPLTERRVGARRGKAARGTSLSPA